MRGEFYQQLTNDLETARAEGLFKEERIITSAQQQISLWLMEATLLTFAPITISDWQIIQS